MRLAVAILLQTALVTSARAEPPDKPPEPGRAPAPKVAAVEPEATVSRQPTATTEPTPERIEVEQTATAGYDGGFYLRTPDNRYSLKIQGRVQTRFELDNELEVDERDTDSTFSIPRARLTLKGHVYDEGVAYKFQSDFGKGNVTLKDFYVDYKLPSNQVRIRAGQFKRPFSRQQINSSGKLELVDRAITDRFFKNGRDIGVAIHNNYEKSPRFEWVVGVFNGTGDKASFDGEVMVDPITGEGEVIGGGFSNVPDEFHPAVVARVGYNHNGIKGYSEADLEGGPLRFAIGASGLATTDIEDEMSSETRAEIDCIVKAHGFSTTGALYVGSEQNGSGMMSQDLAAVGGHVQVGYAITEHIQPVVRLAATLPEGGGNDTVEYTVGVSAYRINHSLKWQTDASVLDHEIEIGSTRVYTLRSQLQLSF